MLTKFNKYYTELDKDLISRLSREYRLEMTNFDTLAVRLKDLYVTDYILQQVRIFACLVKILYIDDTDFSEVIQPYIENQTNWFPDTEGLSKRELLEPCFVAGHLDRFLEILEHFYNTLQKPSENEHSHIPDYSGLTTPFTFSNSCSDCNLETPLTGELTMSNSCFTHITLKPSYSFLLSRTFLNSYCNITVLSGLSLIIRKVKFQNSYVSFFYKDSFNIIPWILQTNLSAIIDTSPLNEMLGVLSLTEKGNEAIDIGLLKERGPKTLFLKYNDPRFDLSEEENREDFLPTVTYGNVEYNLGCFDPTTATSVFTVSAHVSRMQVLESESLVVRGVYDRSKVLVDSPDFSLEVDPLNHLLTPQEQRFHFNTEYELVAIERGVGGTERVEFSFKPSVEGDREESFLLSPETISFLKSVRITYSSTFSPK